MEKKKTFNDYIQNEKFLTEEEELKCMYLRLKEMAARLVEIEMMYPQAKEFKEVINRAIIDMESASHLIDSEVKTVQALRWARTLRGKQRKKPKRS
jgi:hypothetical protein